MMNFVCKKKGSQDSQNTVESLTLNKAFLLESSLYFRPEFLLNSIDAWEVDKAERFDLPSLNTAFHESVPVLKLLDWEILDVRRGYAETKLPLNENSSNQYITHQAALQLVAADYTGGLAVASLFHLSPVIGFWESNDEKGIYMWGAMATIKWHAPSCDDLTCKASVSQEKWGNFSRRISNHQQIAPTVQIDMYNGSKRVAEAHFTYWAQDIEGLRKNAFDPKRINLLYLHKTKTTAKLIAGLRALENQKPEVQRLCSDPYAQILAGKHGLTLGKRFQSIIPEIQRMVAARTRHLDQAALGFLAEYPYGNIVNIGAGYDARFWRIDTKAANVYELDLPVMLHERQSIFMYDKKPNMHCVPIDLRTTTIAQALEKESTFNPSLPTMYIWEGGSMYFDGADANQIFTSLATLMARCSESFAWMDYVTRDVVESKTNLREVEHFITSIRKMGEPFIGGINDIETFLGKHGLRLIDDTSCANYLGIDAKIDQLYHFCTLKV